MSDCQPGVSELETFSSQSFQDSAEMIQTVLKRSCFSDAWIIKRPKKSRGDRRLKISLPASKSRSCRWRFLCSLNMSWFHQCCRNKLIDMFMLESCSSCINIYRTHRSQSLFLHASYSDVNTEKRLHTELRSAAVILCYVSVGYI